ncbi:MULTISPECIES: DNA primase [Sphingobacterium]|uniref:DNA primase n=2 Tax=Sphingobacterium TaxID=28453 RepID=A0ACD5BXT5_9SPHI|nr:MULTISPECIES: DNA primase [Sphingobacterium]HAE69469.1 DNA primase [Sphingobacterium sp.]QQT43105.1 DNA primase [Sphingobacterium multivorum]QQT63963.1 DNA primase [Sphingobacterium multivorum]SUI99809.1 DNA primase [Sphingobacterium multivorum]VXC69221.1 DNA primase [Sphingobacterium multivorum]
MIKQEVIDKVLETARIEEVVGDFVDLKKRGTSLIGNCPFHHEKTPSFHVSVSKGIYKCFGCGVGGDSLKFVMELEKFSYPEAIRYLADKYSIQIEEVERSPAQLAAQDKRESLYVLSAWASKFFAEQLWKTEMGQVIGLNYFKERGYREDIIKKFELGYSPEEWTALVDKAQVAGFHPDYLAASGLAIERDDKSLYDRFRGRVMFPIHNLTGRVIGFGGRTLKTDKKVAKYVNSPESEIYHKSDVLYGLNFAKKAIMEEDNCYLVEGYADVLSVHQAGVENVVSSSGTSLTTGQIKLISRFTKNVTILYDGDEAGIKASLRGTDMLLEEGLNVKVLLFPDGNDPDSYVQKFGATAFKDYVKSNQQDFIFYKTNILLRDANNDPIKRAEVIRDVVESIALIPDEIKVSVFIRECSSLLDIEERILLAELNKIRLNRAKKADKDAARKTQSPPPNTGMPPFGMDGPPPDFFMTDDERAGLPPIESVEQPAQLTSEILQEREIVRILINYGDYLATWEGDGDIPVAGLLLGNISDIEFKDKAAAYILNVYREAAEKYEIPDTKQFYSNSDPAIADLAINCVASKYSLSENWNDDKRKIYVTQEYEHLKQLVVTAIYRIKKRKIEAEMHHIREEMKHEQDVANLEVLIFKYQKLKEAERLLGGFLGNTIVK